MSDDDAPAYCCQRSCSICEPRPNYPSHVFLFSVSSSCSSCVCVSPRPETTSRRDDSSFCDVSSSCSCVSSFCACGSRYHYHRCHLTCVLGVVPGRDRVAGDTLPSGGQCRHSRKACRDCLACIAPTSDGSDPQFCRVSCDRWIDQQVVDSWLWKRAVKRKKLVVVVPS